MTTPLLTKISSHIETQFPEFIRNEGPRFVTFLKTYFESAEQVNEAVAAARSITKNQDIDETTAVLLEYFRREFLKNIPISAIADQRLVTKHIRNFYRARGSADAYRFLFRILFNTEIDFYYPGEDILRCSDGRWTIETILSVGYPKTGDPDLWVGDIVTGETSQARGRIEGVTKSIYAGTESWELTLSGVLGDFIGEETITNIDTGETAQVNTSSGPLNQASLGFRGAYHENENSLRFFEPNNTGQGAEGKVLETTDMSALTFKIIRGAKGYRLSSRIIIGPSTGFGANFAITGLANTEVINLNRDRINSVKNVVLNTGPTFASLGSNSTVLSANLAAANISSTLVSAFAFYANTMGRIAQITLTSVGEGYNRFVANGIPKVTVIDDEIADIELPDGFGGIKGKGAVIIANNAPGALVRFSLTNPGAAYNKNEVLTIANQTKGIGIIDEITTDAQQGLPVTLRRQNSYRASGGSIPGGLTRRVGRYTDTKGFLSWNNRLQDNEFYQEFSYVVKSNVLFDLFNIPVKKLLHPAGTKLFGMYTIQNDLNYLIGLESPYTIHIPLTIDLNTIPEYLVLGDSEGESGTFSENVSLIQENNYQTQILTNATTGYWRLGENFGNTAFDSSGHGLHGTYRNGVLLNQTGALGEDADAAADFDGINDRVSIPGISLKKTVSVEAWIKTTAGFSELPIFSNRTAGGNLYFGIQGNKMFVYYNSATPGPGMGGNKVINDNQWHHIVWTSDGTTANMYVDGELDKTQTMVRTADNPNQVANIGWDASNVTEWFDGTIDEVAIYDHVLPPWEIRKHYQVGTGDLSLVHIESNAPDESWTDMAGTVHIRDLSVIEPFAAVNIGEWANTHIELFTAGSNTALFGLGTTFTALTPVPGDTIIVVATSEATANGLYTVSRVANNTFLEMAPPYEGNLLANGSIRF